LYSWVVPSLYALSPAVKTVPSIPSSNAAVASSPVLLQPAMSPAPTRTGSSVPWAGRSMLAAMTTVARDAAACARFMSAPSRR
jgi:hypothetical protein